MPAGVRSPPHEYWGRSAYGFGSEFKYLGTCTKKCSQGEARKGEERGQDSPRDTGLSKRRTQAVETGSGRWEGHRELSKEPEWGAACLPEAPVARGALFPPGVLEADLIPPQAITRRVGICRGTLSVLTPEVPGGGQADQLLSGHQALYQKSMQALDLLLQAFISENESMDEICFLLQVRAPSAHPTPGPTQGTSRRWKARRAGQPVCPTHVSKWWGCSPLLSEQCRPCKEQGGPVPLPPGAPGQGGSAPVGSPAAWRGRPSNTILPLLPLHSPGPRGTPLAPRALGAPRGSHVASP